MKILTNQLKYWIKDVPSDVETIAKAFTALAYEVEEFYPANIIQGVKVAKTITCEKHPNADSLSFCKVALEDGEEHDVVCGGANVAGGQTVAWALPGSQVGDIKLAPKDLRGITSNGMILSITEIGGFAKELLPKEERHDIVVFDENTSFNDDVATKLTLDGHVIDVSILPDRQYASNLQSLAIELAAYLDLELNDLPEFRARYEGETDATLELGEKATGLIATKIEVGEGETPQWVRSVLQHSGVKVENTLMDVLNYFNIMVGNTSYIVDDSNIKLENNKLNNVDVLTDLPEIKDGYLVTIASSFKTNPMSVKNLDHNFGLKNARGTTNRFMEETLNLIVEYGQKFGYIKSATTPVVVKESDTHTIEFTNEKLFNFIGHEINLDEAFTKLEKLGFKFEEGKVTVPSYRKDVEGIQDLVEEILRFYGIDNVEPKEDTETESVENEFHKAQTERLNDYLVNHGLYEVKTYELLTEKESKSYDLWNIDNPAKIRKDFGVEYNTVQTSLIQGLINVYKYNYRQEREDAHGFYEIQNVFHSSEDPHLHLGVIIDDKFDEAEEATLKLKSIAEETLGKDIEFKETENKVFNPYNSAEIYKDGKLVGVIGELHPKVLREHKFIRVDKVKTKLFYLEIDLESLK